MTTQRGNAASVSGSLPSGKALKDILLEFVKLIVLYYQCPAFIKNQYFDLRYVFITGIMKIFGYLLGVENKYIGSMTLCLSKPDLIIFKLWN